MLIVHDSSGTIWDESRDFRAIRFNDPVFRAQFAKRNAQTAGAIQARFELHGFLSNKTNQHAGQLNLGADPRSSDNDLAQRVILFPAKSQANNMNAAGNKAAHSTHVRILCSSPTTKKTLSFVAFSSYTVV